MKKVQKIKNGNKNAERRCKSSFNELNYSEPTNKEDTLLHHKSSLNNLLNTIKKSLFSIFSNSIKDKNKSNKNLLKELKENLNSLLIDKNSTLKFYGEAFSNKKCSLQNELFFENKIEINKNKYKCINSKKINNMNIKNLKLEIDTLKIINFKVENDIKEIENEIVKKIDEQNYLSFCTPNSNLEKKEISCAQPKYDSIVTSLLHKQLTIKRKKFKSTVSKKQNKIDDIDSIKQSIASLRKSVLKKKSRYTENKEVIIEDYSNEFTRSLDSKINNDNVNNIITSFNKDQTNNERIEGNNVNLKYSNANASDNGNENSKNSEDESNDSYVLSISSYDEQKKDMNININKNIINLNINLNLNSDQINVYQFPENIDYNTDRNTGARTDSRFGVRKTIENHDIGYRNDLPLDNSEAMRHIRYNELMFSRRYDEKTGKLLYKNVSRDLINSQEDIVNWSDHTCFYGYDKDGKLAGIISENRLPDMSKICEYIPVENGVFGTPKRLQRHEPSLYTILQDGSPKEAEYFDICHKALLQLLKFFHELCVKNNIKYTLEAGTLLGAMRDKGFIPWDDDADVSLVREEYDKVINILKNIDLPEDIGIYFPSEKKEFLDFNVRLINQYDGIFMHPTLDIYVMDHFPKSAFKRRLFVFKQQLVFGLAMSRRNVIKIKKYKIIEQIGISILSKVGKLFSLRSICKFHDKVSKFYLNKNVDFLYCTGWSPEYPGWVFDKKSYETMHLTDFEDTKLYVMDDYEEILNGYGDWRAPSRTHDHISFVSDL